ncbi:replication protein A 70 kDa DNA-binding subunit B [Tanacetum coccineum]
MGYQKSPNFGSSSVGSNGFGSKKGKGVEMPSNVTMIKDIEPMLDNNLFLFGTVTESMKHTIRIILISCFRIRSRIQVYIKKDSMFLFEPIFEEGKCYSIANFSIAKNSGRLPLLPHKYKISFYKGTTVTRIDPIDDNVHGFILEPFNRLLDKARVYHEHEVVDVIGFVVAIGDLVPVQSFVGQKIRRTVMIEDAESNQLDCTFWDHWATMWDEYALKHNKLGHVVFILQLGKVKYWNGALAIHNALFGTKMFINRDKSHCIVYAKIHKIHKKSGWANTTCKHYNKKVDVVETKATTSSGKSKVTFYCEDDGAVQAKSRFLFKLWYSDYNVNNNNHTYRCDAFNDDADMIKHFKASFMDDEDDDEGFTNPANRIKSVALNESSITRVMDLHTPPSGMEASGSGQSSGGDKKRVFIDLDSIESEDEDESGSSKTPKLISVKIEKED